MTSAPALGKPADPGTPALPDASLVAPMVDAQVIVNSLLGSGDEGMPYPPPDQNAMPAQGDLATAPDAAEVSDAPGARIGPVRARLAPRAGQRHKVGDVGVSEGAAPHGARDKGRTECALKT